MYELLDSLSVCADVFLNPVFIGLCLTAYLLGSVPFGLVIAITFCGVDPRKAGSGNIGTTNVARLCGLHFGLLTLLADAFKGALPVYFALHYSNSIFYSSVVGFCSLLGHLYSIFLRFRGGKAVATTVGVFFPLAFIPLLISGVVCLVLIWISGFVSLGSLALASLLPVCLFLLGPIEALPLSLIVFFLIVLKHRDNIRRLIHGEEKAFLKKKEPKAGLDDEESVTKDQIDRRS
jgi:glycerol-3-phosphate acyltransferase PlsY